MNVGPRLVPDQRSASGLLGHCRIAVSRTWVTDRKGGRVDTHRADVGWGANTGVWAGVEMLMLAEAKVCELQNWHRPAGT